MKTSLKDWQIYQEELRLFHEKYTPGEFYYNDRFVWSESFFDTVDEMLNHTLSAETTVNVIDRFTQEVDIDKYCKVKHVPYTAGRDALDLLVNTDDSRDIINIEIDGKDQYLNDLFSIKFLEGITVSIKSCGWYMVFIKCYDDYKVYNYNLDELLKNIKIKKFKRVVYICERKFPCDGAIKLNQKLYHLTNTYVIDSIVGKEGIGLCPKIAKKINYYPHRIYFCKDINCVKDFIRTIEKKKIKDFKPPYILLSIDPSNLFYNTFNGKKEQIYFFNDPRKKDSVYTNFNIHKNNIKIEQDNILTENDIKTT